MAPRKALSKKEEIEAIPLEKPVTIETADPEDTEVNGAALQPDVAPGALPPPAQTTDKPDKSDDDEVASLRKQLQELQQADANSRAALSQAEAARETDRKRQQEMEAELARSQGEAMQSQYDAILNAIGAATAEAETAERDMANAIAAAEPDKQADAQRRLARAEARLERLEPGKEEFEHRLKALRERKPEPARPAPSDPFEAQIAALPDPAKNWLRGHREYMTDPRKNAKIQAAHWDALDAGHQAYTPGYFETLEEKLGMREPPKKTDENPDVVVSAPVSRDAPSPTTGKPTNTRITLSPDQRQAAKDSGVDEITYAKNLLKLQQLKSQGHYS